MTYFSRRVSSFLGLLAVLLVAGGAINAAQAQPLAPARPAAAPADGAKRSASITSPTWRANVGRQLGKSLRSHDAAIRERALLNVLDITRNYGGEIDLTGTISALTALSDSERLDRTNDIEPLMALAALDAIGEPSSMRYLAQGYSLERAPRVKRAKLAILNNYLRKQNKRRF